MPRTRYATPKGPRPEEESQLIMAGGRMKLKAARVLSTQREVREAIAAAEAAREELAAEFAEQAKLLTAEQRAQLAPLFTSAEVGAA